MEYTLTVTDVADKEIRKSILAPLVSYNESQAGPSQGRPLVVQVRDNTDAVIGGLWGNTGYGWLFTQLLVVPAALRGQGVGSKLIQLAESEAIARGCHGAWLDTFDFQARTFYERIGYVCFGELPNYPEGFSRFFMRKELARLRSEV
jgi:GNAT superfamily N-acetyltransferase